MTPRALGDVGALLAATTVAECRTAAGLAVAADSAEDARRAARGALPALAQLTL